MQPSPPPVLVARQLSKSFGPVAAVQNVDLEVYSGQVLGLLGPNGAGKTTTLRMLAGILPPSSGNLLIHGLEMQTAPLEAKRRVGFLSGDTQLYQRLSPREVLRFFGRLYQLPKEALPARIDQLVEEFGIGDFADRPCGTLSSGQKQRANLARAFLHEPDLLILDEPTTALDILSGRFVVETIQKERAKGRAILFSTHIMGEAEYLCDRIALMHQGRLIDAGTLPELLERSGCSNLTDAFLRHVEKAQVSA